MTMGKRMKTERMTWMEKQVHYANQSVDDYCSEFDETFKALKAERKYAAELEAQIKAANHDPECDYWRWDWKYSWHISDCTCGKKSKLLATVELQALQQENENEKV